MIMSRATPIRATLLGAIIAIGLAALSSSSPAWAANEQVETKAKKIPTAVICVTNGACEIQFELTNQSSTPFLFLGRVVDETHPRHWGFKDAMQKFPET